MPMAKCVRCKKLFNKEESPVCRECLPDEEADMQKVLDSLQEHPNQSVEEVSASTGVAVECVLRMVKEERVQNVATTETNVRCGKCGAPAISASKRLCEKCLAKLTTEIAVQQADIKLDAKKDVRIGTTQQTTGTARQTLDEKRKI